MDGLIDGLNDFFNPEQAKEGEFEPETFQGGSDGSNESDKGDDE